MNFHPNDPRSHPHRQVHLDFHTSPDIRGIGSRFDKARFRQALQTGHVTSITLFAKCHHGLCYYPTRVGTMHPGLDFDLLGAQMEAAHEIGVRTPIYITAGWSETDAQAHPEWRAKADGSYVVNNSLFDENAPEDAFRPYGSWRNLCLNDGAYCEHIYALTEEICKRYPRVDGFFYDICFSGPCCTCDSCVKGMREAGLDPENSADVRSYYTAKHIAFMEKCKAILDMYHPGGTIFFNSGGAEISMPEYHPYETHYELEDLPTAWGGYDKLPLRASYFAQSGKATVGMTGKFHLDWGEFGGFKSPDALKYEAATMAVYGVGCSVGDHLFPDGEMDLQTYRSIGEAFACYEKLEPYIFGDSTATVGVYLSSDEAANSGISKILIESHIDFRIVRNGAISDFDTVIFPGECALDEAARAALRDYTANGGKVLFCHTALMEEGEFLIDCGLGKPAVSGDECDYLLSLQPGEAQLPESPFLVYRSGVRAEVCDAEVYAQLLPQQFRRTYGHFCGHKNTPYDKNGPRFPAMAKKANTVYLAHPLAAVYDQTGSIYHKRALLQGLMLLQPRLDLKTGLLSQGRCRMVHQPEEKRFCIHMTYAAPVKRGCAEIIEDICPLYDIPFEVRIPQTVRRITLPLRGRELDFVTEDGVTRFSLNKLHCNETVVLHY